jgi:hypothetical protein
MRQLHIRAQSGPRPVTVAAVRALLADGQLDPTGPVLSLDGGRTWQSVESALAVVDGQSVEDGAVDRALRTGPLHPIAMPLGGVGLALLVAGIAFSGSPAAPAIREAPAVAAVVAVGTAGAVVTGIGTAVADGAGSVIGFVGSLAAAGAVQIVMPEMPADQPADKPAADKPAETANGDLLASWRKLVRDQDRAAADWQAATEALGKRTVAEGVIGWNTQLTLLEKITDENRAKMTAGAANADQALRVAVLEINGIDLMLLVVDQAVAEACDKLAAENRDPRISARIATVTAKVDDRTVQFNGTLTAVE